MRSHDMLVWLRFAHIHLWKILVLKCVSVSGNASLLVFDRHFMIDSMPKKTTLKLRLTECIKVLINIYHILNVDDNNNDRKL